MTTVKTETIWTRTFVLLCTVVFLGYAHHALLTPTLPLYVTHIGGSPFLVGVTLAAFSLTSLLCRPTIGYWADVWSYTGILSIGALLLGVSVFLYLFPLAVMLIISNAFRGIGWAGLNTGGYSILADSAPHMRRGEAAGYYTGVQSCAHALFPALALWILNLQWGGFPVVILLSASLALSGSYAALFLKRHIEKPPPDGPTPIGARHGRSRGMNLIERKVIVPAALLLSINISLPVTAGFLVLYAKTTGIQGMGWYFAASGLTHVLTRPQLGRLSDRIGRRHSLAAAFVLELLGLSLLLVAPSLGIMVAGGVLYALGNSIGTSSTMAMAIALADPQRRGITMATFSTAYPMSMGMGALITGTVVEIAGFTWMFITAIFTGVLGLLVAIANWSTLDHPAS